MDYSLLLGVHSCTKAEQEKKDCIEKEEEEENQDDEDDSESGSGLEVRGSFGE